MPVGGVDAASGRRYLEFGAIAIGVGSPQIGDAADGGDLTALRERIAAFAAGFLAGLLRGEPTERCLRLGHVTAASALSVIGDHGPLLVDYDVRATPQ